MKRKKKGGRGREGEKEELRLIYKKRRKGLGGCEFFAYE